MNLWFEKILPYLVLVIFHPNSGQVDYQAAAPSQAQSAELPQALYLPRELPLDLCTLPSTPNLAYSEYNLETILIANPLARTREAKYIGHKRKWYKRLPRLFKDKYNYLPVYFVPMTPPLTPRPDCPLEPTAATKTTSTQLFGVLYITLTGLVDSVVPNSGPWSLLGQSVSYIIKLAPFLWWALPASSTAPHPELPNASTYDWLPDTFLEFPPTVEKTLIQLDCLLSWCCPVLKQLVGQQENTGHILQGLANPQPGKIGNKIPQSVES
ncbi:hypothetical protein DSO57_1008928 [Entomophthora muscae]|uniref:Uncharacterized protein n=1 Tax=Entomophthora muscae TaxID=34485 RepID=A0ACC2T6R7_9FUNG|nr:hypothetical protein DSO57_1008928 [Entomophthora muscae]